MHEPIEGNSALLERLIDRINHLENRQPERVPIPVENPPVREKEIAQKYVGYETDDFRKAISFAHEQLVQKYPGSVGTVEFIDSLTDQYLKQVNSKDRSNVSQ